MQPFIPLRTLYTYKNKKNGNDIHFYTKYLVV